MKLLKFDLTRLKALKTYFAVSLLCLLTVSLSITYLKSQPSLEYEKNNHVDAYEQFLLMSLMETENFEPGKLSRGATHYYKMFEEPDYEERESFLGYPVSPFHLLVQYYNEAFSLEQRDLSINQVQMLEYIQEVNQYLEQNNLRQPPRLFIYDIIKSGDFLFGLIPLFFFNVVLLKIFDDDLKVDHVILSTLPISIKSVPFIRKLAIFFFMTVYIFIIFMVMWLFSDNKSLHLFYPTRSILAESTIIPLYQSLIVTIILFIVRFFLLASIGILIFMRLKNLNLTIIFQIFITFLLIFSGQYMTEQPLSWIPFNVNHRNQVLGNIEKYNIGGRWETHLSGSPIKYEYILWWLLIVLVLSIIISYLYPIYCQNLHTRPVKHSREYLFRFPAFFEFIKNWRAHRVSQLLGIFCVILVLLVGHAVVGDYYRMKEPYISEYTQEDYASAYRFYKNDLERLQEEMAALDQSDNSAKQAYESRIEAQQEILTHYQTLLNQFQMRKTALDSKDIDNYIKSFDYEMSLYFNPNEQFDIVHDTFRFIPRNNYYVSGDFPTEFGYLLAKSRLIELKKRAINPLGGEAIIYNYLDEPQELLNRISDRLSFQVADTSFLGILSRLFLVYRADILMIFFLLMAAMADYELEGKQGKHDAWLNTLPLTSKKVFDSKLKASLACASIFLGCIIAIAIFVGITSQKFGHPNYPIVYFTGSNKYEWVDLIKVLGMLFIMFYLIICLLSILNLIISQWIRTLVVKAVVLFCFVSVLYRLSLSFPFGRYSPFAYLNIVEVVDGSVFNRYLSGESSFLLPIIILVFWNLVFYLFGVVLVTKVERREFK